MSRPKIVVGVDFGTTAKASEIKINGGIGNGLFIPACFSGVSWAKTTGTSEKHLVTDWETTSENYAPTNAKVKTAISYGRDGKANEFGYRANKRACRWFKLLLQREEIHNSSDLKIIEETRELLKTINKTVDDAITDYLRWIWQRADQNLRQYADPYYEKTYGLKVVLTVPAAWKPRAKDRTLQAAKRAGIPADIELVAEPEAAALFVLRSMREDETLQRGDGIVVCDAGGGTVDLISYQVNSLDPLAFRECAVGEGVLCGSVFIDLEFERWIIREVGKPVYDKIKEQHKRDMMRQFEGVKRSFEGDVTKQYTVRLQGAGANDFEEDEDEEEDDLIFFYGDVLRKIFDKVTSKIEALVQRQVKQVEANGIKVKKILLIGGFGESNYIYSILCNRYTQSGIKVLKANNAWAAVARGATEWGLNSSSIASRISRYHYGVVVAEKFDSERHHVDDRFYNLVMGYYAAKDQLQWISDKGAHLDVGTSIDNVFPFPFLEEDLQESETVRTHFQLYYTNLDKPPSAKRSKGAQELCELHIVLPAKEVLEKGKQTPRDSDGVLIRWIDTKLVMGLGGTNLTFSVQVDGRTIGSVKADYAEDSDDRANIPALEELFIG